MLHKRPLSYYTNRLSIVFICMYFVMSCVLVFMKHDHRAIVISLLIAVAGTEGLFIVTIASPNKQIQWIESILNQKSKE